MCSPILSPIGSLFKGGGAGDIVKSAISPLGSALGLFGKKKPKLDGPADYRTPGIGDGIRNRAGGQG
jgi:hypothetical protein